MKSHWICVAAILVAACGGRETTASKSASAYKATPVSAAEGHTHDHGTAATATTAPMDHSTMDHSTMDHSTMDHSAMDHSTMDHSAHGATATHAQHETSGAHAQHSPATHAQHDSQAHAQHGAPSAPANHTQHAGHATTPSPAPLPPPNPETLQPDEFDAPAPTAVAEAQKASGGLQEALYVCPMHPEVTSTTPGKCPKCGMTLVKKEK